MSGLLINPYAFATGGGSSLLYGVTGDPTNGASIVSFGGNYGWRFTADVALTVKSLRVISPRLSGFEHVRLFRYSDGALLADSNIEISTGEWVEVSITPVSLSAAADYVIASRSGAPAEGANRNVYQNPSGVTFSSDITFVDGNIQGFDNNMPASFTSNVRYFMDFGYEVT